MFFHYYQDRRGLLCGISVGKYHYIIVCWYYGVWSVKCCRWYYCYESNFEIGIREDMVSLRLMGFHCAIHNIAHKPGAYFHYLPYYLYLYFTLSIPNNKLI